MMTLHVPRVFWWEIRLRCTVGSSNGSIHLERGITVLTEGGKPMRGSRFKQAAA